MSAFALRNLLFFSSAILLSACTQMPAQVSLRGQEDFGRAGETGSYAYSHDSAAGTQAVKRDTGLASPVGMVSVREVSPAKESRNIVVDDYGTKEAKVNKQKGQIASNPWTRKPRNELEFGVSGQGKISSGYIWPVASREVASAFGGKGKGKSNDGINIAAAEGEPVWATADGEVVYADGKMKGYGNMVLVKHTGGKSTAYAHLSRISVEKYDRVRQGDIIGYVGSSGNVKTPQLYFSMREGTRAVDPRKYLIRDVAGL